MSRLKAFTLIEVLLCCLLLTIVVVGLATLFVRGMQLQRKSSRVLQASQLGQQLLEKIRQGPRPQSQSLLYDGRRSDPAMAGFPPAPYPFCILDSHRYVFCVGCQPDQEGMRRVRVEVFFDEQRLLFETLTES